MSNWVKIVEQHREEYNLGSWGILPESHYPLLASKCGPDEIADIKQRLAELDTAEAEVPEWDGDAQDDIWRARQLFTQILKLTGNLEL